MDNCAKLALPRHTYKYNQTITSSRLGAATALRRRSSCRIFPAPAAARIKAGCVPDSPGSAEDVVVKRAGGRRRGGGENAPSPPLWRGPPRSGCGEARPGRPGRGILMQASGPGWSMAHSGFVHLRVHSAYSLSEGAIKLKELVGLSRKAGMPAVAVTDSCNLFGALEFASYAAEAGIQPIVGCKLSIQRESAEKRHPAGNGASQAPAPDALILLVQSALGWSNLVKLVSKAHLEAPAGEPPQLTLGDLETRSDGLIAPTGGPAGAVGRLLAEGQAPAAAAALQRLAGLFPGRLYVELMRHGLAVERRIEPALLALAYERNLPLVAAHDVYFEIGRASCRERV